MPSALRLLDLETSTAGARGLQIVPAAKELLRSDSEPSLAGARTLP
jgi:hypothetical protein